MRVALRIYLGLKCLALLAFIILAVVFTLAVIDTNTRSAVTFGKLDAEIDEIHRATVEVALTAMEARKASAEEVKMLGTWNTQVTQTMVNANGLINHLSALSEESNEQAKRIAGQVDTVLQTTNSTIAALQQPISQATATLAAAQVATQHLDALVSDPNITATIANVQGTTGHLNGTSADVEKAVHSYLHPTWAHKIFSWTLDVAHALNPL